MSESNKQYRVRVHAVPEGGDDSFLVGEHICSATTPSRARSLAYEEVWDPRLDTTGCSPVYETTLI